MSLDSSFKINREISSIYTAVDGSPDIIFATEEWPALPPNTPMYMRQYTSASLAEVFRTMGCQMPINKSMSDWIFNFLRHAPDDIVAKLLNTGHNNIFLMTGIHRKGYIILSRMQLHRLVCAALFIHQYRKIRYAIDVRLAFDVMESRRFFIVLLSGAPGTGKSTIASLLASRLSISHIISTDSIRHAMRTIYPIEKYPIVHRSTYECAELLADRDDLTQEEKMIEGYKQQAAMVGDQLIRVISSFVAQKTSLIVEGVHLSADVLMKIVMTYPKVIPFLVYIKKEDFHRQRFAVRAKYMTTDPRDNKYIRNLDAIRLVQKDLANQASLHAIPKIDNRNIDRSLETMHATIFSYLKILQARPSMYDPVTKRLEFLDNVWRRRNKKITSKSKTVKDIKALQNSTDHSMAPISELMESLPSEKSVFVDDVGGNRVTFTRNGSMVLQVMDKVPEGADSIPHPVILSREIDNTADNAEPQSDIDGDPTEITLTDFLETTDSEYVETRRWA